MIQACGSDPVTVLGMDMCPKSVQWASALGLLLEPLRKAPLGLLSWQDLGLELAQGHLCQ